MACTKLGSKAAQEGCALFTITHHVAPEDRESAAYCSEHAVASSIPHRCTMAAVAPPTDHQGTYTPVSAGSVRLRRLALHLRSTQQLVAQDVHPHVLQPAPMTRWPTTLEAPVLPAPAHSAAAASSSCVLTLRWLAPCWHHHHHLLRPLVHCCHRSRAGSL